MRKFRLALQALSPFLFLHKCVCLGVATENLIRLPPVGVTRLGESLTFSKTTFNGIEAGPLLPGEFLWVFLKEGEGTLALRDSTDPPSRQMFLQGTSEEINAQLEGLSYVPPASGGRYALTVALFEQGVAWSKAEDILKIVVHVPLDGAATRAQLGVSRIHSGNTPSAAIAFGLEAYDVLAFAPNVAEGRVAAGAAALGRGRAVLMADHQMISAGFVEDSGDFYHRALAWLDQRSEGGRDIRVVTYDLAFHNWLASEEGYDSVHSTGNLETDLNDADVFVGGWIRRDSDENLELLKDFAASGGGLFLSDTGYGWGTWWDSPIYEAPSSFLLREAGLAVTNTVLFKGGTLDVSVPTTQINAEAVLDMLEDSTGASELDKLRGSHVLNGMYEALPPGNPLLTQIDVLFSARIDSILPTPAAPVDDPFDQALLNREKLLLKAVPPQQVTPHRTVEAVYGVVPADAPRTGGTVRIDLSRTRWQATGYYAAPGEVVLLQFPSRMVGKGYAVRVNAHTDDISPRSAWERPPYVHRKFDIEAEEVEVANAFGGAIFVDLGGGSHDDVPAEKEWATVTIEGAVEHSFFVHGVHTNKDWRDIKNKPAPYAVFVTDDLTIVQRSEEHLALEMPHELMDFWNKTMELQTYIAARTEKRSGMELINVDIQNSAGAAHAGFPIQAYDKYWINLADYDKLMKDGSWGDYHELGHNHQRSWWTFSGDTEVTVNIFSIHCTRTLNPEADRAWSPATVMRKSLAALSEFKTYGNMGIWERLNFWIQLVDGWGIAMTRSVFESYEIDRDTDPTRLPTSEAEKKDQWLLRFSDEVGLDLSKFMVDVWGLEVSLDAQAQLAAKGYKTWMPAVAWLPALGGTVYVAAPTPVKFHMDHLMLSMDGVADPIVVKGPKKGKLTVGSDAAGNVWTYTPSKKFKTRDSFSYTAKSSSGHSQGEPLTITIEIMEDALPVDMMKSLQFESKGYGPAVKDSFYFLFRDEHVGPTTWVWWGTDNAYSDVKVTLHPEPGSCPVNSIVAKFQGQQRGRSETIYQMNAGRAKGSSTHSLLLTAEEADNEWLNDETLAGCKFRTIHPIPVDVMHWHGESGIIDEMYLHFVANIPGGGCADDGMWKLKKSKQTCAWLKTMTGKKLKKNCGKKGKDNKTGNDACPLACDVDGCPKPKCVGDDEWKYVKNSKSYNCKKTKKKSELCQKVGNVKGVPKFGYEVCKHCKECEKP